MAKSSQNEAKMPKMEPFSVVHNHCAGIDVGDTEHVVALDLSHGPDRVRTFGAMTCDLEELVDWLSIHSITSVAMESTGVYWKPLFSMLVGKGIEVFLVNAAHVKNVTGRKDDRIGEPWKRRHLDTKIAQFWFAE